MQFAAAQSPKLAESKSLPGQTVPVCRGQALLMTAALVFDLSFVLLVLLSKLIILVFALIKPALEFKALLVFFGEWHFHNTHGVLPFHSDQICRVLTTQQPLLGLLLDGISDQEGSSVLLPLEPS